MPDRAILYLEENDVDVWLAYDGELVDEALLARLLALLDDAERRQQARFYFAHDRKRYLVTRALVRTVLSHYAATAPANWLFATNPYGRPHIANADPLAAGLTFNVSHTHGLVVLAVGRGRELGVDVENVAAREVSLGVARQFFSPLEAAELESLAPQRRQDRFFEYWTFKESYIKARGMGLSLPLDKFSFRFPHEGAVRLAIDAGLGDDAERWQFWQYRPGAQHLLALCAERRGGRPGVVTMRRTIPTLGWEPIAPVLLKSSDRL